MLGSLNSTNPLAYANIRINRNTSLSQTSMQTSHQIANKQTAFGYGVDSDGYFKKDFNEAAGIPEHIKIHSSTMESLYRASVETPKSVYFKIFSDIDVAKTIGNAYKVLSQLVDEETLQKESFSKDELVNLPQGYEYNRSTLEVSKIHQDIFEKVNADLSFDYQNKNNQMFSSTFYNPVDWSDRYNPKIEPATDIFNSANGGKENTEMGLFWDTTAEKYTNSDGTISMGGILVAMVNGNSYLTEGKATYMGQMQGYDRNVDPEKIQAEYYANLTKPVFSYSKVELSTMSEQRREFIKGLQELQMKIWVANGSHIPKEARNIFYRDNEELWQFFDPIEATFKEIEKTNKERLEQLRQKAIESRQKAQEESKKQDSDKLLEESNKAAEELAMLLEKLQEESNKTKEPKDQWNVSTEALQKAIMDMLNAHSQQKYGSHFRIKEPTSIFEMKA